MEIQRPSPFEAGPVPPPAPPPVTAATEPLVARVPDAAPEPEIGPDRELVTLEELEAQLAVLEAELARVDASRGEVGEAPAPAHPSAG